MSSQNNNQIEPFRFEKKLFDRTNENKKTNGISFYDEFPIIRLTVF